MIQTFSILSSGTLVFLGGKIIIAANAGNASHVQFWWDWLTMAVIVFCCASPFIGIDSVLNENQHVWTGLWVTKLESIKGGKQNVISVYLPILTIALTAYFLIIAVMLSSNTQPVIHQIGLYASWIAGIFGATSIVILILYRRRRGIL